MRKIGSLMLITLLVFVFLVSCSEKEISKINRTLEETETAVQKEEEEEDLKKDGNKQESPPSEAKAEESKEPNLHI